MICAARFYRLTQLIFSPHISPGAPPFLPAAVLWFVQLVMSYTSEDGDYDRVDAISARRGVA